MKNIAHLSCCQYKSGLYSLPKKRMEFLHQAPLVFLNPLGNLVGGFHFLELVECPSERDFIARLGLAFHDFRLGIVR